MRYPLCQSHIKSEILNHKYDVTYSFKVIILQQYNMKRSLQDNTELRNLSHYEILKDISFKDLFMYFMYMGVLSICTLSHQKRALDHCELPCGCS